MTKVLMWIVGAPLAILAAVVAFGLAVATPETDLIHEAKRSVEAQLRDGGSAEYQDIAVYKINGKEIVCGKVNAKNGFGAMAGFTRFFYLGRGPAILEMADGNMGGLWEAEGCDGSKGSPVHYG